MENCAAASPGDPCVNVAFGSGRESLFDVAPSTPCATGKNANQILLSDTRGLSIRDVDALATPVRDTPLACASHDLAEREHSDFFLMTNRVSAMAQTNAESCDCEAAQCYRRIISFKSSSGRSFNTTMPVKGFYNRPTLYLTQEDITDAPVFVLNCTGPPSTWAWLNGTSASPNAVMLRVDQLNCPFDFLSTSQKWYSILGYRFEMYAQSAIAGYRVVNNAFETPNLASFVLEQADAIVLADEVLQGHSITMSWGPSFVVPSTLSGDPAGGYILINANTSSIVRDTTHFRYSVNLIDESAYGGRPDIVWITGLDGYNRLAKVNVSDPAAPEFTFYEANVTYRQIPCPALNTSFLPYDGTGDFILGCPYPENNQSIAFAFGYYIGNEHPWFFTDSGRTYGILAYPLGSGCASCVIFDGTYVDFFLDMWDLTADPPVLVDRVITDETDIWANAVVVNNYFFFTNTTRSKNQISYFPVSASLKLSQASNPQTLDTPSPADVIIFSRLLWKNMLVNNEGKYGSSFFLVEAGALAFNQTIPSGFDIGTVELGSGSLTACTDTLLYVRANGLLAQPGALGGLYDYIDIQSYDVYASSLLVSTSSSSTSSSTSMTTSTTTTGGNASPSTPPAPSGSAQPSSSSSPSNCASADNCKYDCSYFEPSKLPKPSVKPSKVPAATKVPEQLFFTLEFTYESTASDCGASVPDCCDVREWLGETEVASSFYLCSADSVTKKRAPEYDSKAGTCSVFLAAPEGTDAGEITEAQFESALAELESRFAALCPADVRNCDLKTQSGKSLDYILSGSGVIMMSTLVFITLVLF